MSNYTTTDIMVTTAAQELVDGETVFVGIGMPMLASNLAKHLHYPDLQLVYESGVIGAPVTTGGRMPTSIADPRLASGAVGVLPMFENFSTILQGGRIDVGFLGGAQIDRYGNINSTVIGEYEDPTVRLPGSGGACEIASNAKRVIIITPHESRRFPERVDFITSPGHLGDGEHRSDHGLQGGGPAAVITDKAVMRFDDAGEMYVEMIHPRSSREAVQEATGWDIAFADSIGETPSPSDQELRVLREELDPDEVYIDIPGDE